MTTAEIFSDLAAHSIKGLMAHSQLADYYRFLGLPEYADCHEKHYKKESCNWRKMAKYYITHYNHFIPEKPVDDPKVIPEEWFRASRQDVDTNTIRKAVQKGLELWVDWEKQTKTLYETHYKNLIENGDVAAAMFLKKYICDVDDELAEAQEWHLYKKATDYDISHLISEQK